MTPPPGRLDFACSFAAAGTKAQKRPAPGVGHMVFIAPYSGATKSPASTRNLSLYPLELGEAFNIMPAKVSIEPLAPGHQPYLLCFEGVEALHPDALLETVPSLREIWEPLRELDRDSTAPGRLAALLSDVDAHSVADLGSRCNGQCIGEVAGLPAPASMDQEAAGDLLDRLLGKRPADVVRTRSPQAKGVNAAAELVHQMAARALREEPTTPQSALLEASSDLRAKGEAVLASRLRALLRQQAFQNLSGMWLATEMVVRSCPDDSKVRFSAVDASWKELLSSPIQFATLLEYGASTVVIDHCFGTDSGELCGLVQLVRACHERGVFLVAGAVPSLAGLGDRFLENPSETEHDTEAWQDDWSEEARASWGQLGALREQGAQFALALPRCLVRHPYGKWGEPVEDFAFEELEDGFLPDRVLWASGAYLVARALVEQCCGQASQMDGSYEIGGLPLVSVPAGNGRRTQPPVELTLPQAAVEQLLNQGFSIVEARRDSDRARVHV